MKRLQRFLRWLWPPLALAGSIWAVWRLYFERHHFTPAAAPWIPVGIGVAYVLAILYILATTRSWNATGLGQLATYAADASLYLGLGAAQYGWRHPFTPSELNLIRAELTIGGPCLVLGLLWWSLAKRDATPEGGRRRWRRKTTGATE